MGVDTYNVTINNRSADDWFIVFTWAPQTPSEDFQHLAWRAPHSQGNRSGGDTQTFSFSTTYQAALSQKYLGIGDLYQDITTRDAKLKDNFSISYDKDNSQFDIGDGVTSSSLPVNAISFTNKTSDTDFAVGIGVNGQAAQMAKPRANTSSVFYTDLLLYCSLASSRTKLSQVLSFAYFQDARSINISNMVGRNININIKPDNIWTIDAK